MDDWAWRLQLINQIVDEASSTYTLTIMHQVRPGKERSAVLDGIVRVELCSTREGWVRARTSSVNPRAILTWLVSTDTTYKRCLFATYVLWAQQLSKYLGMSYSQPCFFSIVGVIEHGPAFSLRTSTSSWPSA